MEIKEIAIENIRKAFSVANNETKEVLSALFGTEACEAKKKPTLDDYTTIKSYEDACEALGEAAINEDELLDAGVPQRIISLMKLETISKALWGRTFKPIPDAEGSKVYYYPWFALYTKTEIENFSQSVRERGALLAAHANTGASAGFGCLFPGNRSSSANAHLGFRLCQENEEKARYLGVRFINLWAEYLAFEFTVGERIF